jgi:hypothetical protein
MPWINHRPAEELGKTPSELINFSLSISQIWELNLFVIFIRQLEKIRATSTTFKNNRDKNSSIRLKKQITRVKSESINKLNAIFEPS